MVTSVVQWHVSSEHVHARCLVRTIAGKNPSSMMAVLRCQLVAGHGAHGDVNARGTDHGATESAFHQGFTRVRALVASRVFL